MKSKEAITQTACVNWFRYEFSEYLIYSIPNGGSRNVIEAANLKRQGVLAGIPDIHIPVAKKGFNSLYIELKAGKNKTTSNQNEIIEKLRNLNNKVEICYSFDDFYKIVTDYLNE